MAEMNLPEGWAHSSLEESISCTGLISDGDWVESKDQDPNGSIRLIQLADVGDGEFRDRSDRFMTTEQAERLNCTFLRDGDILVARMPDPLGRACIFPELNQKAVTVVDICLIRTGNTSAVINKLLMYWINSPSFRDEIQINATGTTRKRITRKKLEQLPFPLPPLAEQKVIADQLDSLLAQVERTKARLERIPTLMKQFRQSVLADAVSGKLTEGWREENGEDIANWVNTSLGNVANVATGKTPLRTNSEYWVDGTIPWLTSASTGNIFTEEAEQFITAFAVKDCALKIFPIGTLLLAMYGEGKTRGQVTEIKISATCNQACAAITVDKTKISLEYMKIRLQENYEKTRKAAAGGAQPNLNLSKVREIEIHLPTLKEQTEIVRRVETLFAHADSIEQQAKASLERVNQLTQSIPAKAFRGELTAQWRKDHPELISGENSAEALLVKIAQERATLNKQKKTKSKQT